MKFQIRTVFGLAAFFLASGSVQAACVAPGGVGGCFATVAAAVAAATAGSEIKIGAGRYGENVVVPAGLDGLKLIGAGAATTIVNPAAGLGIDIQANNVTVSGLSVRNTAMASVSLAAGVTNTVLNKLHLANASNAGAACLLSGGGNVGTQLLSSRLESCTGATVLGNDAIVRSNRILRITGAALTVTGTNALVDKNTIELATAALTVTGDNGRVQNNRVYSSGVAVVSGAADSAQFSGNKLFGPAGPIVVIAANNPNVLNNSVKDLGIISSVLVTCTANCALALVSGNRIDGSAGVLLGSALSVTNTGNGGVTKANTLRNAVGLTIAGAGQHTVEKNTVRTASLDGILVTAGAPARLLGNTVQSARSGIALMTNFAHFLEKNKVSGNREAGILITGALPILNANTANNNLEEGIENTGGATALTGNKAKGNLNFDYCSATVPIPAPGNFFGTTGATCI